VNNKSDPVELFRPDPDGRCFCGKNKLFKSCCGNPSTKRRPPSGVTIKHNFLPNETCDKLVAFAEMRKADRLKVRIPNSEIGAAQEVEDKKRVAYFVDLGNKQKIIDKWVADIFHKFLTSKIKKKIRSYEKAQLMRYTHGGFYQPHSDADFFDEERQEWKKVLDRDYSLLLYLNDDYERGSIHFEYFNYTFKPAKGDLLIFPSNYLYLHEARQVKSGVRYVVVSWANIK
jgi:hypothetical protein